MAGFEYMPEDRLTRVEETISDIKEALVAPNFNEEDRGCVEDSLEHYEKLHAVLKDLGEKALQNA